MGRRGFTLIEVLVALVVLSIGLLALAKMNVVYLRSTTQAHQVSEGVLLAQDKMEELRRYATGDQPGSFAVYGFEYLTSGKAVYTEVPDPDAAHKHPVAGLLAGAAAPAAALLPTTGGTVYEVLYDDGAAEHGDAAAGDGIYSNSDTVDTATQAQGAAGAGTGDLVRRVWSVQPIELTRVATNQTYTDYAKLAVDTEWVDRQNKPHRVHLESLAHRRQ